MRISRTIATAAWGVLVVAAALLLAQAPPAESVRLNLTATTANVSGAPDSVRLEILRWSTEAERDRLMAAWELRPGPADQPGAGKGAAKGKGGAKGKGTGPADGPAEIITPQSSLASALQEITTVGYLWSSEVAGYALRYAGRVANPDGSQRIILLTQRRLGATNQLWNPTFGGTPNTDEFSVIELRLNARGEGEGKVSLASKVVPDGTAKIVGLENYNALPAVFRNVQLQAGKP